MQICSLRWSRRRAPASPTPNRQAVFKVVKGATKSEIRRAVELMFGVEVERVTTATSTASARCFSAAPGDGRTGRRPTSPSSPDRKSTFSRGEPSNAAGQGQADFSRAAVRGPGGDPRAAQGQAVGPAHGEEEAHRRPQQQGADHRPPPWGGHKRTLRIVDFRRDKDGVPAKVERLEYDPNRSAHLLLLLYADGERRYIIAPRGVEVGARLQSGPDAPIRAGNCLPLRNIPVGSTVHCVEFKPGTGARIARSAGASAQVVAREGRFVSLRLRSGEIRRVPIDCRAVIGKSGTRSTGCGRSARRGRSAGAGSGPPCEGSDESGGPSPWRRRRPHVGRPSPGHPVRSAPPRGTRRAATSGRTR